MKSSKNNCLHVAGIAGAILLLTTLNISAAGQDSTPTTPSAQAWVGARIIDGTGKPAIENATLLIRNERVDDFLGARQKMSPEVYGAVIDEAHKNGFRTAAHIVLLEDARGVLRAGVNYIAHSVRDREVDDEFIRLMKKRHAFYSPTLTRELAVFTYSETPSFFTDPFFLKEVDPAEMAKMEDPKRQDAMRNDPAALWYKEHMLIAMRNLKRLSDAGIVIAAGTDSGGGPG